VLPRRDRDKRAFSKTPEEGGRQVKDTQTPRTDAAETNWWSEDGLRSAFIVRAEFARELEREIARLTAERDEARREICMNATNEPYRQMCGSGILLPQDAARERGWDCYKEDEG